MKRIMTFVRHLILTCLLGVTASSCNKDAGLSDGKLSVNDFLRVERTSGGGYLLVWSPASGAFNTIEYQVYFQDLGDGVDAKYWENAQRLQGGRPFINTAPSESINPQGSGRIIKAVSSGTFYEIDLTLTSTHAYAFTVVAKDDRGQGAGGTNVLVLGPISQSVVDPTSGETTGYVGCAEGKQVSPNAAEIRLVGAEGAKDIVLFRDGAEIGRAGSDGGVIRDQNVKAGAVHVYTCQAIMRGEVWVGSNAIKISFDNPFAGWQGCRNYAFNHDSIDVEFDFPEGAQKVEVMRDGKKVFETMSSARTKFVDKEVIAGETYQYECIATLDRVIQTGPKVLRVAVPDLLSSYPGCSAARALGTSEVLIDFTFPAGVSGVNVYRNGIKIFSTNKKSVTSYLDSSSDLVEAQTYRYTCGVYAGKNSKIGPHEIAVTTLTSNPPSFAGITEAIIAGPTQARVRWGVDNGAVPAAYYKIYATPGSNVDWAGTPVAQIPAGKLDAIIEDLGDELTYSFGIRACSIQDICDQNTVKRSALMPDDGAPKTSGAISASIINGKMVISAPWNHKDGALAKRYVYVKSSVDPNAGSLNIADYNDRPRLTFNVSSENVLNPPTSLEVSGLAEYMNYFAIVIDEDPSGQKNIAQRFAMVQTNDLTPPSFSGITALTKGEPANQADTTLKVTFPELQVESSIGDGGASTYLFYIKKGGGNACLEGTLHDELAVGGPATAGKVSHIIRSLTPATLYAVCVKARDQSGNISNNTEGLSKKTLDLTPPVFDGVQLVNFNKDTGALDISWNPSASSDVDEYRIRVWKHDPAIYTEFIKKHFSNSDGFALAQGDSAFTFTSLNPIHAQVSACDSGATIPDGVKNCSDSPQIYNYIVPDITPPAGFTGVLAPLSSPEQGKIVVRWASPPSWDDYRGFRIYTIAPDAVQPYKVSDLRFLTLCECEQADCSDMPVSCTISGLPARKTFRIHVRAYDSANNQTTDLSPNTSYAVITTADTTTPVFSGGLNLTYDQSHVHLTWDVATDNQDPTEPNAVIGYEVWRRTNTTFSNANNPGLDGQRLITLSDMTEYSDGDLASSTLYYYTICAVDASLNRTCQDASAIRSLLTPDVVPPAITDVTTSKFEDPNEKVWDLTFTVTDNLPQEDVIVNVYKLVNLDSIAPEPNQFSDIIASGDGTMSSVTGLSGPANQTRYIHYLIEARDQAGLKTHRIISLLSENEITITNITRPIGLAGTKRFIVINGGGFAKGVEITLKDGQGVEFACARSDYFTPRRIGCSTELLPVGIYDIIIENPNGTGDKTILQAYRALSEEDALDIGDACDQPDWNTLVTWPGAGAVTICTADQLDRTRNINNKAFRLGDNIDLKDLNFPPMGNSTCHSLIWYCNGINGASPYGDNYSIANWTHHGVGPVAFFGNSVYTKSMTNFNLIGIDISGGNVAGVAIQFYNASGACNLPVDNVHVQGKITVIGAASAGGISITSGSSISNSTSEVEMHGPDTTSSNDMGALVASMNCAVYNSSSSGSITAYGANIGGIASKMSGDLQNNSSTVRLTRTLPATGGAGGLVFQFSGSAALGNRYTGRINAMSRTGGLFGLLSSGTDKNIANNVIQADITGEAEVGGIIGTTTIGTNVYFTNNQFTGTVVGTSTRVGGAIGRMVTTNTLIGGPFIYNKNSVVSERIEGAGMVGGFIGQLDNCVTNTYCTSGGVTFDENRVNAKIKSSGDYAGGIVGQMVARANSVTLKRSRFRGSIAGTLYVGGIAGFFSGRLEDSYAMYDTSAVNDKITGNQYVGGAIGRIHNYPSSETVVYTSTVQRIFSAIKVEGATDRGGLIGAARESGGMTVTYGDLSAWDIDISGQSNSIGSAGSVIGRASNLMKTSTTYLNWDFGATTGPWMLIPGQYPKLRSE